MSLGEFIELRDLGSSREQIELTGTLSPCSPPRLERANALRISPGKVPDLLSRVGIIRVLSRSQELAEETGEGHNFQPCSHAQPTWCDLCGDFIWGLYKQSLQCVSESSVTASVCTISPIFAFEQRNMFHLTCLRLCILEEDTVCLSLLKDGHMPYCKTDVLPGVNSDHTIVWPSFGCYVHLLCQIFQNWSLGPPDPWRMCLLCMKWTHKHWLTLIGFSNWMETQVHSNTE